MSSSYSSVHCRLQAGRPVRKAGTTEHLSAPILLARIRASSVFRSLGNLFETLRVSGQEAS